MKLVFPNRERDSYELKQGVNRIGSGEDCDLRIAELAAHHADIEIAAGQATIRVEDARNVTRVNGNLVVARTPVRGGDALLFGELKAQVVGLLPAAVSSGPVEDSEQDGETKIRRSLPNFILRGVSGETFGKNFAVRGPTVLGRHSDCDVPIPNQEISRKHARVTIAEDGLLVEDLGSANGTFINGKRVRRGKLNVGDELRLDTVRFLLQSPAVEPAKAEKKPAQSGRSGAVLWAIVVTLVLIATVAALVVTGIVEI